MVNELLENLLEKPDKQTSELKIFSFERDIGYKLPEDYKQFLLQYNGGFLKHALAFDMYKDGKILSGGIETFYGFLDQSHRSLENGFFAYHIHQKRMLKGMIPIGSAGGGNHICMLLSPEEYGHIFYWIHDWEVDFTDEETIADTAEEGIMQNCYFAAKSFTEFLNNLRDPPE